MTFSFIASEPITLQPGDHLLTFAQIGFSPLSLQGEKCKVPDARLKTFAETINRLDQFDTLLPAAPISAVPVRLIKEAPCPENDRKLVREIKDFLQTMKSRDITIEHLYIDFGAPNIPSHAERAVRISFNN